MDVCYGRCHIPQLPKVRYPPSSAWRLQSIYHATSSLECTRPSISRLIVADACAVIVDMQAIRLYLKERDIFLSRLSRNLLFKLADPPYNSVLPSSQSLSGQRERLTANVDLPAIWPY
jgi:hypothetical protein